MKNRLLLILLLILTATNCVAASFDCTKASTLIERMICADDDISKLDDELSKIYTQALLTESSKDEIKKQQLIWIKKIRNSCKDPACLKIRYEERIAALNNATVNSGASQNTNGMSSSEAIAELIPREVTGNYLRETENENAELKIRLLNGSKVRVTGTSFYGTRKEYGPNIGELDFVSTIQNGHVKYFEKAGKKQQYKLELTFKRNGIIAKEEGVSKNFGLNVTFAGEYKKISTKQE